MLLAAAVPVAAGLSGIVLGPTSVDLPAISPSQDSHARYLSGLLLGIGLAFWSTVPSIERQGARFRLLAAMVVLAGLARLLSLVIAGQPSTPMLAGLGLELAVVPLLALWQSRVAARAEAVISQTGPGGAGAPMSASGSKTVFVPHPHHVAEVPILLQKYFERSGQQC